MSNLTQARMRAHALGAAIAAALSSLVVVPAFAANRVDLHALNLDTVNSQQSLATGTTSQRHAQMLGMDRESGLVALREPTTAANGARNHRYQQTFRGIPVFGENVIVSENRDGSVRLLYGRMVTGLAGEVPAIKPRLTQGTALAIAKRAALGSRATTMRTKNEKVRQMIYIDGNDRAHMSYVVDFFADTARGGLPTRPQVVVDADSGKILRRWEGLTTDEVGTGPGGNAKTGQYEYGTDFGFNDVQVNGANCTMFNTNVRSIDLDGPGGNSNNTPFVYSCYRNTYKTINNGYSPINDAHFFGGVVYNMYGDYLGEAPLNFQLTMKVHYGTAYENAFWDGLSMTFGDGATTFYPLVGLDVSAHEVSHGYTEQNSGLIYDNQSGGMNEAFSDIAGEAADSFFRGAPDFLVGAEIFKAAGQALRYMYDPPLDGISIDNFADYNDNIDVHYSSGIYNKAYWALATTSGWDAESAFRVFANANRDYWVPDETMLDGSCKVEQAAADNGYNVADVQAAFAIVGLDCADPGEPDAGFTYTRDDMTVQFTDTSTDSDGSIVAWDWDFGDGGTSTEQNPSHTYAAQSSYDVTLTVTDDDGITDTVTMPVATIGGELENGVPVSGIDGEDDSMYFWTLEVPAGATNLRFQTTSSDPDADLYVKFGAPPTTTDYDCRGFTSTSNELCAIDPAQEGTYYVMVHAWTPYTDLTLVGSYDDGGPGTQTYTNDTDYNIPEGFGQVAESPVTVSGRTGNAPADTQVHVEILHTRRGDLRLKLIAPDGTEYLLKNASFRDGADNVIATYTVDLSSEALNGTWKLRARDVFDGDVGHIDTWSITF